MTAKKKKSAQKTEDTHVIDKNKISKELKRVEVIYTITGQQEYLENDKYPCVDLDSENSTRCFKRLCYENYDRKTDQVLCQTRQARQTIQSYWYV